MGSPPVHQVGGGRHRDPEGETTTELALHDDIQAWLDTQLHEVILPGRQVKVAHRWSGIMGFGDSKSPVVRRVDERVVCGVGLGGMGVAPRLRQRRRQGHRRRRRQGR